jgi:AcrR family transcriptional regulator
VPKLPPALTPQSVERKQISRLTQREERREQVLARMTQVFAKRGYQAATVDHLIGGAKISMGGFYKEFEGKEDCFVQAYARVIAQVKERLDTSIPKDADWATQMGLGIRALVEFASEKPLAARVVLLEAQTGGELALARYSETLREVAACLRRGREIADAKERLPVNFEDATASGLLWLLQSRVARGRIEDAEELWPHMAKMALEPYVGAKRADEVLRAIA